MRTSTRTKQSLEGTSVAQECTEPGNGRGSAMGPVAGPQRIMFFQILVRRLLFMSSSAHSSSSSSLVSSGHACDWHGFSGMIESTLGSVFWRRLSSSRRLLFTHCIGKKQGHNRAGVRRFFTRREASCRQRFYRSTRHVARAG